MFSSQISIQFDKKGEYVLVPRENDRYKPTKVDLIFSQWVRDSTTYRFLDFFTKNEKSQEMVGCFLKNEKTNEIIALFKVAVFPIFGYDAKQNANSPSLDIALQAYKIKCDAWQEKKLNLPQTLVIPIAEIGRQHFRLLI